MVELSPAAHRVQLVSGLLAGLAIMTILIISPGLDRNALTTLEKIQRRGHLDVLTLNSATTYYQDVDGPDGFEFQLATWFADAIGVEARIKTVPSFAELYTELLFGSGDLVAAGLSEGESVYSRSVAYGPRYYEVTNQVLYRKFRADRPRAIDDLVAGRLKVIAGSDQARLLRDLRQAHPGLAWAEADDIGAEELIEQVDTGEVDYAIVASHDLALQRRFFPELRIAFELGEPRQLRWAFDQGADDSLARALDEFFSQIAADGRLDQLVHRHYSHVARFNYSDTRTFTKRIETHLPRYEALFREAADAVDIDWRLLAAIGYQESLWNARARSPTGVRGLMMLTLTTAKQMKVKNRLDPAQSIRGGARYFARIRKRVAKHIPEPDRTWFALAAYNVGLGHLEDARDITAQRGGDPDRWIDVRENLPLLARKKWYKQTKYGYARGWEPVKYVANIRQYYDYLVGLDNKELRALPTGRQRREVAPLAPSL